MAKNKIHSPKSVRSFALLSNGEQNEKWFGMGFYTVHKTAP